jgi:hypothetical protein
MPSVEISLPLT